MIRATSWAVLSITLKINSCPANSDVMSAPCARRGLSQCGHTMGLLFAGLGSSLSCSFEIESKLSSVRETLETLQRDPCIASALCTDSQPPWDREHGFCHPGGCGVHPAPALDQVANDKTAVVHRKSASAPASAVP